MKRWARSTVQSQPHSRQGPDSSVHPGWNLLSLVASLGADHVHLGREQGGSQGPRRGPGGRAGGGFRMSTACGGGPTSLTTGHGTCPGPNWPRHQAPRRSVATPSHRVRVDIAAGCVWNTSGAREHGWSVCGSNSSPRRGAHEVGIRRKKDTGEDEGTCGEQVPGARGQRGASWPRVPSVRRRDQDISYSRSIC